ncbi:hypothetical protein K0M31_000237, partial [Melipona bicolor]
ISTERLVVQAAGSVWQFARALTPKDLPASVSLSGIDEGFEFQIGKTHLQLTRPTYTADLAAETQFWAKLASPNFLHADIDEN